MHSREVIPHIKTSIESELSCKLNSVANVAFYYVALSYVFNNKILYSLL